MSINHKVCCCTVQEITVSIQCTYVTGFLKMCVVYISHFAHLRICKIYWEWYTDLKFSGKIKEWWFYSPCMFGICMRFLKDFMDLWSWKIVCVDYTHVHKSSYICWNRNYIMLSAVSSWLKGHLLHASINTMYTCTPRVGIKDFYVVLVAFIWCDSKRSEIFQEEKGAYIRIAI